MESVEATEFASISPLIGFSVIFENVGDGRSKGGIAADDGCWGCFESGELTLISLEVWVGDPFPPFGPESVFYTFTPAQKAIFTKL